MKTIDISPVENISNSIESVLNNEMKINTKTIDLSDINNASEDVCSLLLQKASAFIVLNKKERILNPQSQLLSFYKLYFNLLENNREVVISTFKNTPKLKTEFKSFINKLEVNLLDYKRDDINILNKEMLQELVYKQFLFTLSSWTKQTVSSYENTDLLIKKAVDTSFFLLDYPSVKA